MVIQLYLAALSLHSSVECPDPDAVQAALNSLDVTGIDPGWNASITPPAAVTLSTQTSSVQLRLRDPDGTVRLTRSVPAQDCDAAADAIAVVLERFFLELGYLPRPNAPPPAASAVDSAADRPNRSEEASENERLRGPSVGDSNSTQTWSENAVEPYASMGMAIGTSPSLDASLTLGGGFTYGPFHASTHLLLPPQNTSAEVDHEGLTAEIEQSKIAALVSIFGSLELSPIDLEFGGEALVALDEISTEVDGAPDQDSAERVSLRVGPALGAGFDLSRAARFRIATSLLFDVFSPQLAVQTDELEAVLEPSGITAFFGFSIDYFPLR